MASSLGYLSIDLYLPSLPAITKELSITYSQSQLTVTTFLMSFCLSQLIYGPLSDHYGRKPILGIGLIIYMLATIICITTTSINLLLVSRFFQGIGIGAGAVLSRVMLRDKFSGNALSKMASILNVGVSVVTTISPLLGGFIQSQYNYHGNFAALLFFGVSIFGLLFFIPETNINKIEHPPSLTIILRSYFSVFIRKSFILNVLCAGIALSTLIIYSMTNPFLIQSLLGFSPAIYGIFALMIAGCEVVGSLISAYLVERIGITRMLFCGFVLMVCMGSIMVVAGKYSHITLYNVLLPTMGLGISIGIILPNASAGAFSIFNSGIGVVGALYGFIQLFITTISSSIIASFAKQSQFNVGLVIVLLGCLGLFFYMMLIFSKDTLRH